MIRVAVEVGAALAARGGAFIHGHGVIGEIAAGAGDSRAGRARCVQPGLAHRLDQSRAGDPVTVAGRAVEIIERRLGVLQRPCAAFDERAEIGRRERRGQRHGIGFVAAFGEIFRGRARDIDHIAIAQRAGAFVGSVNNDFHDFYPP